MTYMWLFEVSWELPADEPGQHRRRLHIDYPIRIDSALAAGAPPGQRLQRALRQKDRLSLLDKAVTMIYGTWFLPHLLLGYALLRHHEFVPRAAGRLAASYHLTTPFYWFVPTAPPWYASEIEGRMDGDVQRVVRRVVCQLLHRPMPSEEDDIPGNPWGSPRSCGARSRSPSRSCGRWPTRWSSGPRRPDISRTPTPRRRARSRASCGGMKHDGGARRPVPRA